jgi:hypothetical protein
MRFDIPDVSRRLDAILRDLGYLAPQDRVDRGRAFRVVRRRTLRPVKESRFADLCKGSGAAMTAEEAVMLADSLGFDVRRLLYDDGLVPKFPERPSNIFDELDIIGLPE